MKQFTPTTIVLSLITLIVIIAISAGFFTIGSPFDKQKEARDQQRLGHFTKIKTEVESFYKQNKRLPKNLTELKLDVKIVDPSSKKIYELKKNTNSNYNLCATFETDTTTTKTTPSTNPYSSYDLYYDTQADTTHKIGLDCINYSIPSHLQNSLESTYYDLPTSSTSPYNPYPSPSTFTTSTTCQPYIANSSFIRLSEINPLDQTYNSRLITAKVTSADIVTRQIVATVTNRSTQKETPIIIEYSTNTQFFDKYCTGITSSNFTAGSYIQFYAPIRKGELLVANYIQNISYTR